MKLRARFGRRVCTLSIGRKGWKAAATCQRRHARGLSVERHPCGLNSLPMQNGCRCRRPSDGDLAYGD